MSFCTPGIHLQNLILDGKSTSDEKLACLKTLRIILKNLADPLKASDPKYRSIKLIKISAKFAPCPSAMEYLKAIGFTAIQQDGEDILKIDNVDRDNMEAVMCELQNALEMITPSNESLCEEKKVEYERGTTLMSTSTASFQGKMSEKQKARILLEKKEREERDEAKRARKKTKEQIAQDKYVRENDENWTSKQSAACVKSGSGISTFRDKYGE